MVCLIIEAALVAQFVGTKNTTALSAAVAMFYVYVIFYEICLDGPQFAYLGELFPTHIRAKGTVLACRLGSQQSELTRSQGMNIGVAGICLMNIIWLQAAPTAFQNIGWKF